RTCAARSTRATCSTCSACATRRGGVGVECTKSATTKIGYGCGKLNAKVAAEVARSDNDARFDLNLRFGLIQYGYELTYGFDVLTNICDDECVAAAFNFDCAATRESALNDRKKTLIASSACGIAASAA